MKRLLLVMICLLLMPAVPRADETCEKRLNQGIAHDDAHAYMLIDRAGQDGSDSVQLLQDALSCAPDLPAVYFALSRSVFSFTPRGILDSVDYLIQGLRAYADNFWWSFNLAVSVMLGLLLSLTLAVFILLVLRMPADIPLINHDIREGNFSLIALILLIPLSALSPLFFAAGVLILLGLYMKTLDRLVVYIFLFFLLLSPLLFKAATQFTWALTSGKVKAVVQVNQSQGNSYALSALNETGDFPEVFSYALALKRAGQYDRAIAVYSRLAQKTGDPRAYVNLGNCYVGLYRFDEGRKENLNLAEKYYAKAVSVRPLAAAYYNLSQVSREMLDFTKGDEYFRSALSVDRSAVASFSLFSARSANRFVADKTLTSAELWHYAMADGGNLSAFGVFAIPPLLVPFMALALAAAFYLFVSRFDRRSFRCRKCGRVLCPKCEKRITWRQMCPQCYGSLVKLDELDVRERVSRLLTIYARQRRRRNTMKVLSFVMPGTAQIYAGRILSGFFLLWSYLFFLSIAAANSFLAVNAVVFRQGFLSCASVFAALILYISSNIITRRRIATGWL